MFADEKDMFLAKVAKNRSEKYWIYYGLKAAPLTKAHEEIICNLAKCVQVNPNLNLYVGCAESEWKHKFLTLNMLSHFVDAHFNGGRVNVIDQDGWLGLYNFLISKSKRGKLLPNRTLVVVGEDEKRHLDKNDGVWLNVEEFMKDYCFHCAKLRNDGISSTKLREIFYRDPDVDYFYVKDYISKWAFDYIKQNEIFWQLKPNSKAEENVFIQKYDASKFDRPSVTVDNIVWGYDKLSLNPKILLIRRGGHPYRGYWALPGGFLDVSSDNTLEDAAIRELREETSILCHDFTKLKQFRTYGNIGTDPRTRIVDVVYSLEVDSNILTSCRASDDAVETHLFNIDNLPKMAFNHKQIIEDFLNADCSSPSSK